MKHTKRQLSLGKSSFTLLETLFSITLIIIIVSGFVNSSFYDKTNQNNYMLLNSIENKFDTKNYSDFSKSTKTLKVITNESSIDFINVDMYSFENNNISLIKYEK